jgi:transposase InsO family protein
MCRVLEVSVAGFYAYLKRPPSWRALIDEVLMAHIRIAFVESGETYGAPRVLRELQEAGVPTSTKRVARLMREDGLVARPRKRRRVVTTNSNHSDPIAPNLLGRQFDVNGVTFNRVWIGDITHIPTREGPLYLATVLDLESRRCVGWAMRDTMEVELVLSALRMARDARRPAAGVIFHSDRGSQYASSEYRTELAAHGMIASMSGKGDCYDNAVAESFFATLKVELVYDATWDTRAEARAALFEYIEGFYNGQRRHSTLGYLSPRAFEMQRAAERGSTP